MNEECKLNEIFESNGFTKIKDRYKLLHINIGNDSYYFDFETNYINKIPNTDIEFAIAVDSNFKSYLFINKDYNPLHDDTITSPNRTFYEGLMKEPFKLVYSLDTPIKVETDSHVVLQIQIEQNIKGYLFRSSESLKDEYKTKEKLIEHEKIEHFDYLEKSPNSLFNKENVDAYLENLNKCSSWEEIERVYNKRPYNDEIR